MATIHYTTDTAFYNKIRKLAGDYGYTFTAEDQTMMNRRLENAYREIESVLVQRGLTIIQVSTWARGEEFQLDIATYWYGRDNGWGGQSIDERDWIAQFDRRKELLNVPIIDNDGNVLSKGGKGIAVGMDLLDVNESKGYYW